jgi:integrase
MKLFAEMFGNHDIGLFTLEHLEQFKARRKETRVSSSTINIDIRTIKAAFALAVDWGRITRNPFVKAKQLKVDQKAKRVLSPEEFEKILAAIREDWLHDIIAFNVLTGLRLGEVMNLKWADYDAAKQEITVQSSSGYRVKGGKMRIVSIGPDGVNLLNSRPRIGEWIFVGNKGKKYTDDYVSRKFKDYVRKVGLPEEIHYHRLRDTYCTWMAEKNVPIHIIKALAGHSSVRVTEGYITANVDAMKDAAGRIGLPTVNKIDEQNVKEEDKKRP